MPPRGASKAAPKPCNGSKTTATVPAAPTGSTDLADPAPEDPPVTPPPRPQGWVGQLHFETPGEQFPPVSPGSSDEGSGVASTGDVFAPPVLTSPIKHGQRQAAPAINKLADLEVWNMTDEEIIGGHF